MKTFAFILCAALAVAQTTVPAVSGKVSIESTSQGKALLGGRVPFFKGNVNVKNVGTSVVQISGGDVDLALTNLPTIPSTDANPTLNKAYQGSKWQRLGNLASSISSTIGLLAASTSPFGIGVKALGYAMFGEGMLQGPILGFVQAGQPPLDISNPCDQLAVSLSPGQFLRCVVYIQKPPKGAAQLQSVYNFELDATLPAPNLPPTPPPVQLRRRAEVQQPVPATATIHVNPDGLSAPVTPEAGDYPMPTVERRQTALPVIHVEELAAEPTHIEPWADTLARPIHVDALDALPVQAQPIVRVVAVPLPPSIVSTVDSAVHEALASARPLPSMVPSSTQMNSPRAAERIQSYQSVSLLSTNFSTIPLPQAPCKACLQVRIQAEVLNQRGRALMYAGKLTQAVFELREAVRLDSESFQAANALGFALHLSGDERGALDAYDAALRINSNYPNARANRALTLRILGQVKRAQL